MTSTPGAGGLDAQLLDGLKEPTKDLLLQTLLYKSMFTGQGLRSLAEREGTLELRDALLRISYESVAEGAALTLLLREWDKHLASWDDISSCAHDTRLRLLDDLVTVKEGLVEAGLAIAMSAPNASLRSRFLKLVDLDRVHADELRRLRGTPDTERLRAAIEDVSLGAGAARHPRTSFGGTIRRQIEAFQQRGRSPMRLVVAPEGARHLRDEGLIGPDARVFGLSLDVDLAWQGEAFAIVSEERTSYATLVAEIAAKENDARG
ncbi:MAG TPA: hypothetical protein VM582_07235 [Candidatus Thermoplasmatota archaeon]|nr:hypothetical protein [Candidatus Thermoplasmatota archaeon]